jgi:hypothetical protein
VRSYWGGYVLRVLVRKLIYVAVGLAIALIAGHRVYATTCYVFDGHGTSGTWDGGTGSWSTGSAACAADVAGRQASGPAYTWTLVSSTPSGAPTAAGQPLVCQIDQRYNSNDIGNVYDSSLSAVGSCGPSCSASSGAQDLLTTIAGSSSDSNGLICYNGCGYTNSGAGLVVGNAQGSVWGQAVPTGGSCSPGTAGAMTPAAIGTAQCFVSGGNTLCFDDPPANQGEVNGDVANPSSAPASGTCQGFASGGVLCTVPASPATLQGPPAPTTAVVTNGVTTDVVDTPAAIIQTAGGTVSGKTLTYFSPSQVSASATPVGTTGGSGSSTGGKGSTGGSGTGTGGTGTGTGACPPGQTCTGTDSDSGGTSCASAPVCTDTDPVQCAQVNQVWLLQCQTVQQSDINAGIASDAVGPPSALPATTTDMSTAISETGIITVGGGATCPAPSTFTVLGNTVSYDIYGPMCSYAGLLSGIVLAVAYLIAARVTVVGTLANTL